MSFKRVDTHVRWVTRQSHTKYPFDSNELTSNSKPLNLTRRRRRNSARRQW